MCNSVDTQVVFYRDLWGNLTAVPRCMPNKLAGTQAVVPEIKGFINSNYMFLSNLQ